MKGLIALVIVVSSMLAAGCTPSSQQERVAQAQCISQTEMTGDLAVDIVGLWRWTWTGPADGGPSAMLLEFRSDESATTTGHKNGPEKWHYRITDIDEVWMTGADAGDDLQSLRTAWVFNDKEWNIADSDPYGVSTLERCTNP